MINEFQQNAPGRPSSGKRRLIAALAALGIALCAAGFVSHALVEKSGEDASSVGQLPPIKPKPPAVSQALSKIALPTPSFDKSGKLVQSVDGYKVTYTLDKSLQKLVEDIYAQYKVPYGAFVAMDPSTGRILAMAEHSSSEPEKRGLCLRATYPAASLIKVITGAAALKTGKVTPATQVRYEGNPYRLTERKISPNNAKRERLVASLTDALAKSNNIVFAKMGINVVGAAGLESELNDFCFNREIPFEFALQKSTAIVPSETWPLGQTAAGFGDVYVSPVHAALIAATVANKGVMMKPWMVEKVEDQAGNVLYSGEAETFAKVIEPDLAKTLSEMMTATVANGTGTKVFKRYAKKLTNTVSVAGKTGSLSGDDPPGRYEWFIGFAPQDNPKIAVASLVVNKGQMWHIKGAYAAAAAMKEHLGLQ